MVTVSVRMNNSLTGMTLVDGRHLDCIRGITHQKYENDEECNHLWWLWRSLFLGKREYLRSTSHLHHGWKWWKHSHCSIPEQQCSRFSSKFTIKTIYLTHCFVAEFILTPAPSYTYRTIGGLLDIYIFMGPTPEKAIAQYHQAIGPQPIPAYWSLGFNLCRWSYNSVANMRATIDRLAAAGIPQVLSFQMNIMRVENTFSLPWS